MLEWGQATHVNETHGFVGVSLSHCPLTGFQDALVCGLVIFIFMRFSLSHVILRFSRLD